MSERSDPLRELKEYARRRALNKGHFLYGAWKGNRERAVTSCRHCKKLVFVYAKDNRVGGELVRSSRTCNDRPDAAQSIQLPSRVWLAYVNPKWLRPKELSETPGFDPVVIVGGREF